MQSIILSLPKHLLSLATQCSSLPQHIMSSIRSLPSTSASLPILQVPVCKPSSSITLTSMKNSSFTLAYAPMFSQLCDYTSKSVKYCFHSSKCIFIYVKIIFTFCTSYSRKLEATFLRDFLIF